MVTMSLYGFPLSSKRINSLDHCCLCVVYLTVRKQTNKISIMSEAHNIFTLGTVLKWLLNHLKWINPVTLFSCTNNKAIKRPKKYFEKKMSLNKSLHHFHNGHVCFLLALSQIIQPTYRMDWWHSGSPLTFSKIWTIPWPHVGQGRAQGPGTGPNLNLKLVNLSGVGQIRARSKKSLRNHKIGLERSVLHFPPKCYRNKHVCPYL